MRPVASHKYRPGNPHRTGPRRAVSHSPDLIPGTRIRDLHPLSGGPAVIPLPNAGRVAASQRRWNMESTNEQVLGLPGTGFARMMAAAKAGLAVIGLAVVLAAMLGFALPEPREALLRPVLTQLGWNAPWD